MPKSDDQPRHKASRNPPLNRRRKLSALVWIASPLVVVAAPQILYYSSLHGYAVRAANDTSNANLKLGSARSAIDAANTQTADIFVATGAPGAITQCYVEFVSRHHPLRCYLVSELADGGIAFKDLGESSVTSADLRDTASHLSLARNNLEAFGDSASPKLKALEVPASYENIGVPSVSSQGQMASVAARLGVAEQDLSYATNQITNAYKLREAAIGASKAAEAPGIVNYPIMIFDIFVGFAYFSLAMELIVAGIYGPNKRGTKQGV